ncbi:MAG: adenine phosphoribosyltransferase, partial [Eubacterium sp.]|nr:adenine phosphoribosyltransferase [Eubacterium sp.]
LGGEIVKMLFVMELAGLNGRDRLKKYDVYSAVTYEGK